MDNWDNNRKTSYGMNFAPKGPKAPETSETPKAPEGPQQSSAENAGAPNFIIQDYSGAESNDRARDGVAASNNANSSSAHGSSSANSSNNAHGNYVNHLDDYIGAGAGSNADHSSGADQNNTNYYWKDDSDSNGYNYGASGGFGGGSNSGFSGNNGPGAGFGRNSGGKTRAGKTAKAKVPMQITKKAFVLVLILCMLVTSALTVGGFYVYGNFFADGTDSATNYSLSSSTETMSYKSIINKVQDSVVSITTESVSTDTWAQNYVTEGAGSGVIIQSNGYIVTCNHVISGASKVTVTLSNKKEHKATVVGTDSSNDVAVLKIKATGLTAATYGNSSKLTVGDQVVAIGNPLGELSNTATTGIISALNRNLTIDGQSMNLLQTDASINPGNSGGALFNSAGNLIGIVVAKSTGSDVEGLGFAIPINKVAKVAKNLIKNGSTSSSSSTTTSGSAVIGVTVYDSSNGVYVQSVTSSKAKAAGIEAGDLLYSVAGTTIDSTDTLKSVLSNHKAGDKVKVIVIRDNQQKSLTVTLSSSSN